MVTKGDTLVTSSAGDRLAVRRWASSPDITPPPLPLYSSSDPRMTQPRPCLLPNAGKAAAVTCKLFCLSSSSCLLLLNCFRNDRQTLTFFAVCSRFSFHFESTLRHDDDTIMLGEVNKGKDIGRGTKVSKTVSVLPSSTIIWNWIWHDLDRAHASTV